MSAHATPPVLVASTRRADGGATRRGWLLRLVLPTIWALLAALGAYAQEALPEPVQYPPPFEVRSQLQSLEDAAAQAEARTDALGQAGELLTDLGDLQARTAEVQSLLGTIVEAEYARPDRLVRIRDRAARVEQDHAALLRVVTERLADLDELRADWTERRAYWQAWREALQAEQRLQGVQAEMNDALVVIDAVLARIEQATASLLGLQEAASRSRAEAERVFEEVAAIRVGRREALLERSEPVLFSGAFAASLLEEGRAWRPLEALRVDAYGSFLRESAPLIFLHLLLVLALALLARRLRGASIPEGAWSGLLLRPRALAVFGVTAVLVGRYPLAPALWDVAMWALLAGSGVVLATRLVRATPLRVMVYVFAGFYPLFLLFEAVGTPPALFRPVLVAAAVMGLAVFGFQLARALRVRRPDPRLTWPLGVGCGLWLVVLAAEVLGFYLLARWLLHASIATAFAIFVVFFLVVLARGTVQTLLRLQAKGRLTGLRSIAIPLAERLLRVLQLVLVVAALLHVLDLWELAPSPAETWRRITGVGFTVAGVQLTLGRVLWAVLLVYLAVLLSWTVRTLTQIQVYPRWELERGVGDSINALVHYVLITLGVLVGLGALGVELQNFAIVAGALGVGIGFGLQNVVNNFVSGLILLFERPVRVGDTVVIGTEFGTVQKIGLRSTTVLTFDQAEVIVPNADLVSEKVTNWTLSNPVARLILPVGVAYGTNVALVLELLGRAAQTHPDVLGEPAPQALFMTFGESALEFELRVWVQELRLRLPVRSAILAEVDRLFREHGVEIPFPQRDLHLRSVDAALLDAARGQAGERPEPPALPDAS